MQMYYKGHGKYIFTYWYCLFACHDVFGDLVYKHVDIEKTKGSLHESADPDQSRSMWNFQIPDCVYTVRTDPDPHLCCILFISNAHAA